MKKFAVFSGFLGSGKTTAMIALTQYFSRHHGKAAMISNDLGGEGLADHWLARLSGCNASELTGTCICYQTENLANRLWQLFNSEDCSLVLSDIPGFGIGALDHVYGTLHKDYPELCQLAPFTVLCEPATLQLLEEESDPDLSYILLNQLKEADLIVLTKCDLLSDSQKEAFLNTLSSINKEAELIPISALSGDGLENLSQALIQRTASMRQPDLGYGGNAFCKAMGRISELNLQYYAVVCCDHFDGTAYLQDLAEDISNKFQDPDLKIPHMKLLAWEPEGDYGKVDLLGADRPPIVSKNFVRPCTELAVVLNVSAFCPPQNLDSFILESINRISDAYQLSVTVFKKECFSVMGES